MTIRQIKDSDYQLVADLTNDYANLGVDILGFDHISQWLVSILKKPFALVYEDGDNKGFIVPEKMYQVLFVEGENDRVGNLEVFWYMIPYSKAAEVEFYTVLPELIKAFTADKIKAFNILEGFQQENGNTNKESQSDEQHSSSNTIEDSSSNVNTV